jgi:hypothetical protein
MQALSRFSNSAMLALLGTIALFACGPIPQPSDFHVGMSRQQIVAEFGEPQSRKSLVKSDPYIWGPIETFWSSVPMGARVEIWSYPTSGGAIELYFVDDSSEVGGTAFAPEGAVY